MMMLTSSFSGWSARSRHLERSKACTSTVKVDHRSWSNNLSLPIRAHFHGHIGKLTMSEIQNVAIVSHEVKSGESKPFVTYNVKGTQGRRV